MCIGVYCMCKGTDSARKTSRQGSTMKARSLSKEVEDELASMRGTKDTDRIAYLERKDLHGVSNAEEEPRLERRSIAAVSREDNAARGSRDISPAKSLHLAQKHAAKLAADKGIT